MAKIRFTKKTFTIFLIILIGAVSGAFAGAFMALTHDLPQIRSLEDFKPDAMTRIYSSDKEPPWWPLKIASFSNTAASI
jgi:penicillin-binding protein 1A